MGPTARRRRGAIDKQIIISPIQYKHLILWCHVYLSTSVLTTCYRLKVYSRIAITSCTSCFVGSGVGCDAEDGIRGAQRDVLRRADYPRQNTAQLSRVAQREVRG